jgi:hypothetical protein
MRKTKSDISLAIKTGHFNLLRTEKPDFARETVLQFTVGHFTKKSAIIAPLSARAIFSPIAQT